MNAPCPNPLSCPGQTGNVTDGSADNPFANLSSEKADAVYYKNVYHDTEIPALGTTFSKLACTVVYNSTISQADADQQAAIAAKMCVTDTFHPPTDTDGNGCPSGGCGGPGGGSNGGPGGGTTPSGDNHQDTFLNTEQSCTTYCPDGTAFTASVPAGEYSGRTQLIADTAAKSIACQNAQDRLFCLPDIGGTLCIGSSASYPIDITTGVSVTYNLALGSVPTGMVFHGGSSCVIDGTATAAGDFSFTVQATDANGHVASKEYTISVVGITSTSPLPGATAGTPYSYQVTAGGYTTPVFSASGMPSGLSMDSSGLISGTPTGIGGTSTISVTVSEFAPEDDSVECSASLSITVTNANVCTVYWDAASTVSDTIGFMLYDVTGSILYDGGPTKMSGSFVVAGPGVYATNSYWFRTSNPFTYPMFKIGGDPFFTVNPGNHSIHITVNYNQFTGFDWITVTP